MRRNLIGELLFPPLYFALWLAEPFRSKERTMHPDLAFDDDNMPETEQEMVAYCPECDGDTIHLALKWVFRPAEMECEECGRVSPYDDEDEL